MVIQQTGVGGHYVPPGANGGLGNPVVSAVTQNYSPVITPKTPAPPPIPVLNGNYTNGPLPPPPPPPAISQSPALGLVAGHQPELLNNGLDSSYPAYPHPVPPVHPVNGFHDTPDHELLSPDHPTPPSPPSAPPFMEEADAMPGEWIDSQLYCLA